MNVQSLDIPDVKLITPRKFGDDRGFFSETYNKKAFTDHGIELDFVQDNHSLSTHRSTVRGLHFQAPPHAQTKLVRVTRGAALDIAVDMRSGSPTFGKHVAVELCAENWHQLLIPTGFAHGFCTLADNTEVQYKVTDYFVPEVDFGVLWNDPDLAIDWGVDEARATLSDKDRVLPRLAELDPYFNYDKT